MFGNNSRHPAPKHELLHNRLRWPLPAVYGAAARDDMCLHYDSFKQANKAQMFNFVYLQFPTEN